MDKYELKNNIDLYYLKTEKFKTISVSLCIYRPMGQEASANSLLAGVLKNGSKNYPTKIEIEKHLEWLYGGTLLSGIRKKGETQVLSYMVTAPSNKYTGEDMAKQLSEFLYEIVFNPNIINDGFDAKSVSIEKENLKNRINALLNDKKEYAMERCVSEMCKDEPFGIYELGTIADVDKLDAANLKLHYDNILKDSKIDIFVSGECDIETVKSVFDNAASTDMLPLINVLPARENMQTIEESLDVNQGKLVIGMRADCPIVGQDYYNMVLFNSIFGAGTHSKLFNNVREKLSLAYYAYSRLIRQKSIIMVGTGIEFDKYEQTKAEIFHQLDEMKNGNITDFEIEAAKNGLINAYKSLGDTPMNLEDYYISAIVAGSAEGIDEMIKNISGVTKEGIINAAKMVVPDTIYFLKGAVQ